MSDFSDLIPQEVSCVYFTNERLGHIRNEHTFTGDDMIKGSWLNEFINFDRNIFFNTFLLLALESPVSVTANEQGGYRLTAEVPFIVGRTGAFDGFGGAANSFTNRYEVIINQRAGDELPQCFKVRTSFPVGN